MRMPEARTNPYRSLIVFIVIFVIVKWTLIFVCRLLGRLFTINAENDRS